VAEWVVGVGGDGEVRVELVEGLRGVLAGLVATLCLGAALQVGDAVGLVVVAAGAELCDGGLGPAAGDCGVGLAGLAGVVELLVGGLAEVVGPFGVFEVGPGRDDRVRILLVG
jgi:hypothetical protein